LCRRAVLKPAEFSESFSRKEHSHNPAEYLTETLDPFCRIKAFHMDDQALNPKTLVALSLQEEPDQPKETIMATAFQCFDDPKAIFTKEFCVSAASKDLKGDLKLGSRKEHKCSQPACKTLRTAHALKVKVVSTRCDSPAARPLNGVLSVKLVTAFDTDGLHRGFHAGDFTLVGAGGLKVTGRMSGVTNEGSHRLPIRDCQECGDLGIMEGRLCGRVVNPGNSRLRGCQVIAAYRISFDQSFEGGSGAVVGTLEGVVICACKP
jgi:hypothetical protein